MLVKKCRIYSNLNAFNDDIDSRIIYLGHCQCSLLSTSLDFTSLQQCCHQKSSCSHQLWHFFAPFQRGSAQCEGEKQNSFHIIGFMYFVII